MLLDIMCDYSEKMNHLPGIVSVEGAEKHVRAQDELFFSCLFSRTRSPRRPSPPPTNSGPLTVVPPEVFENSTQCSISQKISLCSQSSGAARVSLFPPPATDRLYARFLRQGTPCPSLTPTSRPLTSAGGAAQVDPRRRPTRPEWRRAPAKKPRKNDSGGE